ncbi:MAG: hypothetical protein MJZ93_06635 [Paludibacteraceae bacterium]|nr:hypothetical protein [Paludibacteraceae bacterium]
MKKVLFTLATVAMLFATSCKKENINAPEKPVDDNEFLCVIEPNANPQNAPSINGGMRTMAELINNRAVWQEDDQIAYFGSAYDDSHSPIKGYKHVLTCKTFRDGEDGSAYFEAEGTHFGQGEHKAFYPAELLVDALDADHYTLALPAVQTIDPERNASNLPMYGVGSGSHYLTFYNLCGVLKIEVPVASNKIVLTAAQALCGPIHIGGEDDKTAVADGTEDQHKTLTLEAKEGTTFAEGGFVYAAIPAGTYNSLTIKFYRGDYLVAEKTTTNALTVARNTIKNINTNIPREGLYFTAVGGDVTLSLVKKGAGSGSTPELSYSVYNYVNNKYVLSTDWTEYNVGTDLNLTNGQRVFFIKRTDGVGTFSTANNNYFEFTIKNCTGTAAVGGNVMYLIDKTGQASSVPSWCFHRLFVSCSANLTNVDDLRLPATEVQSNGYNSMFHGTGIAKAPELPAMTLASSCYYQMFKNCMQLTTAPNLPATTLAESCYSSMFEGCYSLSTAPDLPATTLAKSCYSNMFKSCSYLTTAPALPAETLAVSCYEEMFNSCSKLVFLPDLPAPTLVKKCYKNMFSNCGPNSYSKLTLTPFKMLATGYTQDAENDCLTGWLADYSKYERNKVLVVANSVTTTSPIFTLIVNNISTGWTIQTDNGTVLRERTTEY